MKNKMQKKRRKFGRNQILGIVVAFMVIINAGMIGFVVSRNRDNPMSPEDGASEQMQVTVGAGDSDNRYPEGIIEMPYGTLYFDASLGPYFQIDETRGDDYCLEFFAKLPGREEIPLFDIFIAEKVDDTWGKLLSADGTELEWCIVNYPLESTEDLNSAESELILQLQEIADDLAIQMQKLSDLPEEETEQMTETEEEPEIHDSLRFMTPKGEMEFATEWAEHFSIEYPENGNGRIIFCADLEGREKLALFAFDFNVSLDEALGIMMDSAGNEITVGLNVYDLEFDSSWTAEEKSHVAAMQALAHDLTDRICEEFDPEIDITETTEATESARETEATESARETEATEATEATEDTEPTIATEATEPPEEETEAPEEPERSIVLKTPCGDLEYVTQWADYLRVEYEGEKNDRMVFYAQLEGKEKIELFVFEFDVPEDHAGFIGTMKDSKGNEVNVALTICELELDESWSPNERNQLYVLMDESNGIMELLV